MEGYLFPIESLLCFVRVTGMLIYSRKMPRKSSSWLTRAFTLFFIVFTNTFLKYYVDPGDMCEECAPSKRHISVKTK